MTIWMPKETDQKAIKFWLDCLQIVIVVLSVVTAAGTFFFRVQDEKTRIEQQQKHDQDQIVNQRMQLAGPYEEKKLQLYLEASRVVAHLAATPNVDKDSTEARFWELYWGELAFVESRGRSNTPGGAPSIENLMVAFCKSYFPEQRCSTSTEVPTAKAALTLAHQASDETRERWDKLNR